MKHYIITNIETEQDQFSTWIKGVQFFAIESSEDMPDSLFKKLVKPTPHCFYLGKVDRLDGLEIAETKTLGEFLHWEILSFSRRDPYKTENELDCQALTEVMYDRNLATKFLLAVRPVMEKVYLPWFKEFINDKPHLQSKLEAIRQWCENPTKQLKSEW